MVGQGILVRLNRQVTSTVKSPLIEHSTSLSITEKQVQTIKSILESLAGQLNRQRDKILKEPFKNLGLRLYIEKSTNVKNEYSIFIVITYDSEKNKQVTKQAKAPATQNILDIFKPLKNSKQEKIKFLQSLEKVINELIETNSQNLDSTWQKFFTSRTKR